MFEKHPEVRKNEIREKKIDAHMRFSSFDECNLYQNHTKNLAFATRASHYFKKYLKKQNFTFSKVIVERTLRQQLPIN